MTSAAKPAAKKESTAMLIVIWCVVCVVFSVVFRFTFLFLMAAVLPSIVAMIVDRTPKRRMFRIVFSLNLAGTLPFLLNLWQMGNRLEAVKSVMTNAYTWLIIYGSSGMGWGIVWMAPQIALILISGYNEAKIMRLQYHQRKLLEEWGPEIKRGTEKEPQ